MRKLGINSVLLSGSGLLAQAITALTLWLVARALGPAELGTVLAAVGIATLLAVSLDFGVNSYTLRQMARRPDRTDEFTQTLAAKVVVSGSVAVGWIATTLVTSIFVPGWLALAPLGLFIAFSSWTASINTAARSVERMDRVVLASLSERVITLGSTAFLLHVVDVGKAGLPWGMALGTATSMAVAYALLEPKYRRLSRVTLQEIATLWRNSIGFGITGFASQIGQIDVTLVAIIAGSFAAGLYGASGKLSNALTVIPSGINAALFPRLSRLDDRATNHRESRIGLAVVAAMSVSIAVVFAVFATPLIRIALGSDYLDAVGTFRFYVMAMATAVTNSTLSTILQAFGAEMFVARITTIGAIVGLAAIVIGAFVAGPVGAGCGFLSWQIVNCAMLFYGYRLELRSSAGSDSLADVSA